MKALLILVLVVPHPPRHLKAQAACKGEEEGVEVYSVPALSNGHVWEMVVKRTEGLRRRYSLESNSVRRCAARIRVSRSAAWTGFRALSTLIDRFILPGKTRRHNEGILENIRLRYS